MMIGIVGPDDSVNSIESVARELRIDHLLVPARYATASEVPRLVESLLPLCRLVLFSGRLPYQLSIAAGLPADQLDYIPHEGADLFRVLALAALRNIRRGHIPRLSFDCMTDRDVGEVYEELGLSKDYAVIPLERDDAARTVDVDDIAVEHRRLLAAGSVTCAASCIHSVYETLLRDSLPVVRIEHSRFAVRQALLKAKLCHDLARAEASQTAACLLSLDRDNAPRPAQRRNLLASARRISALLDGHVLHDSETEIAIIATREAVERRLKPVSIAGDNDPEAALILAVGLGANAAQAKALAIRARERAVETPRRCVTVDGTFFVYECFDPDEGQEQRQLGLEISDALRLSPMVARRLLKVFSTLDATAFTAGEFAQAYMVEPRSARRLLQLFKARNLVEERGALNRRGAGRPEAIYQFFIDRLLSIDSR